MALDAASALLALNDASETVHCASPDAPPAWLHAVLLAAPHPPTPALAVPTPRDSSKAARAFPPAKALKAAAPAVTKRGDWALNRLHDRHARWQHDLRQKLAVASPPTVERLAPFTELGPLETALVLSQLSAADVALLDAPVRLLVVDFQRKAAVLLWHNPKVRGVLRRSKWYRPSAPWAAQPSAPALRA